jgi:hypothetical protein
LRAQCLFMAKAQDHLGISETISGAEASSLKSA